MFKLVFGLSEVAQELLFLLLELSSKLVLFNFVLAQLLVVDLFLLLKDSDLLILGFLQAGGILALQLREFLQTGLAQLLEPRVIVISELLDLGAGAFLLLGNLLFQSLDIGLSLINELLLLLKAGQFL